MLLKAYAKINLTLDVLNRRQDGYHNIDSVMQSVSLCDVLKVEVLANDIKVIFKDCDIDSENNTVYKAAEEFFRYTSIQGGALIEIEKNIPQCAGLGGPSADAAAVIVALDRLCETGLKKPQLMEIGLKVGADVPFCIVGGTQRVGGIGEKIQTHCDWQNDAIVLAKRGLKNSTGQMYSLVDSQGAVTDYTERAVKALESGKKDEILKTLGNAFSVCYPPNDISDLREIGAKAISLSGSGPTYFCIFEDKQAAKKSIKKIADCGFWAQGVQTVPCGVEIIED